jgi:hypothetical protein
VFTREHQGPPAPLSQGSPHPVPPELEAILLKCLAFRREDRPQTADELEAMFAACEPQMPWQRGQAREWWRVKGSQALAAARREREEHGRVLFLATLDRARSN